jgi:hypothetical protein
MARNEDWTLINDDEHEVVEEEEDEQDEERPTCGDRELSEDQRRRWYDDATDPEPMTGLLSW